MGSIDSVTFWLSILGLGVATFLIRFSFLGLIREGALPHYVVRLLRYVPVSVLPALVAPLVVFPRSLGGETNPVWVVSALFALALGILTRSLLVTIVSGMGMLWVLQTVVG